VRPYPLDAPSPSSVELRQAILVLLAARNGGVIDVLNPQEPAITARAWEMAEEELMDCVLSVGNSVAALRDFIAMR
jgi:hypothetical protein